MISQRVELGIGSFNLDVRSMLIAGNVVRSKAPAIAYIVWCLGQRGP